MSRKRTDSPQGVQGQSFWEHLDELRAVVIRISVVTLVAAVVAFCFKDEMFAIVLSPKDSDFITYRLLRRLALLAGEDLGAFTVPLINTGLAKQFVVHMEVALAAGVIVSSPYILYQLFRFVSPALYANERSYALRVVGWGYVMFIIGVLVSYFVIFPLTFRFLGTYQVSADVDNLISLESYISTLVSLSLCLGIFFEMPVLSWLFARFGLLSAAFMRRYRRHAIVLILVVAAIITPTSDVFTLMAVSLPMWLLYEMSVLVIAPLQRPSQEGEKCP
ncbi:MAG: twin-arginine translocase subunit TatC [Bacteroidaceae bacterium]|nr:twin-arginine translocase subunit TatC [Bacteroidaceae bacterium]